MSRSQALKLLTILYLKPLGLLFKLGWTRWVWHKAAVNHAILAGFFSLIHGGIGLSDEVDARYTVFGPVFYGDDAHAGADPFILRHRV